MVATAPATMYRLYIGGEWQAAESGRTFDVRNPATDDVIARVPNAGQADMRAAIESAVAAQKAWADTTASERGRILTEVARAMHAQSERLARIMTEEEGKPLAESRGEIKYAASFLEWFAEEGKRIY